MNDVEIIRCDRSPINDRQWCVLEDGICHECLQKWWENNSDTKKLKSEIAVLTAKLAVSEAKLISHDRWIVQHYTARQDQHYTARQDQQAEIDRLKAKLVAELRSELALAIAYGVKATEKHCVKRLAEIEAAERRKGTGQ